MPSNSYSTLRKFRVVMLTVGVVLTAAMSCRKAASPTTPPTQVEASRTTASRSDDADFAVDHGHGDDGREVSNGLRRFASD